jgi:hypothetical protein
MPDSDWTIIEGDEYRMYEEAFGRGRPPAPDFSEQQRTRTEDTNDRVEYAIEEVVFERVESSPPGEPVSEFCSRCPGHVHTVDGDVPEADRVHTGYLRWGEHRGVRYRNARVRGTEIRRELMVIKVTPAPLAPPGGPGLGFDLGVQWRPEREHRFIFWSFRDIDRVIDGIVWRPFDTRPCTAGGGYYVGLQQAGDLLCAAVGQKIRGAGPAPAIVGNEFLPLLRAAARLRQPSFDVTPDGDGWIVALVDVEAADKEIQRVRAMVEQGYLTLVSGQSKRGDL